MRSAGVQLRAAGFHILATAIKELSFTDPIDIDQIVPGIYTRLGKGFGGRIETDKLSMKSSKRTQMSTQ